MKFNKSLVYGVGTNDIDYAIRPILDGNQVKCSFYSSWADMLRRCYSEKYQETRPTYIGCSVCREWLTFSNFKRWMEKQDWIGKQLDKDLLIVGNKIYSPDTCAFVPACINSMIRDWLKNKGEYPIGVSKEKVKYKSSIRINSRLINLGRFHTKEEAHKAWQKAKMELIYKVVTEQTDNRIKDALLFRCNKLQGDIDNNIETTSL